MTLSPSERERLEKRIGRRPKSFEELRRQVFSSYKIDPVSGCWNWQMYSRSDGYGTLWFNGKHYYNYRLMMHFALGFDLSSKLFVLHRCDNPRCINPAHLFIGTPRENSLDMVMKNRQAKGTEIMSAKLTTKDVKKIRQMLADGKPQIDIAKRFSVGQASISRIKTGETWGHI